ncbi:hypothetical protein GCM10010388_17400 [Streptomyces mauvecolor]
MLGAAADDAMARTRVCAGLRRAMARDATTRPHASAVDGEARKGSGRALEMTGGEAYDVAGRNGPRGKEPQQR